jgi:hypothetical protein
MGITLDDVLAAAAELKEVTVEVVEEMHSLMLKHYQ